MEPWPPCRKNYISTITHIILSPQVPLVHEQRPDRADRAADPDAQPALPHDGLHAARQRRRAHHRPQDHRARRHAQVRSRGANRPKECLKIIKYPKPIIVRFWIK